MEKLSGYRTSDGTLFQTELEARNHEEYLSAIGEFHNINLKIARLIAKKNKTADGETFDLGGYFGSEYWYVFYPGFRACPVIRRISVSANEVTFNPKRIGEIIVSSNGRKMIYDISDLYMSRKKAKLALISATHVFIKELQDDVRNDELKVENYDN